jgi:G3E family GTPase
MNKIDLITEVELKHIEKDVAQINSKGKVYKISANINISNNIWEEVTKNNG